MNVFEVYTCCMDERLLGSRVRMSRNDLGLTQAELASMVSISRPYLTNIERGRTDNVGIRHITALAECLGVSVEYLIGIDDNPLPDDSGDKLVHDSHVIYEITQQEDRRRVQQLLDAYLTLSAAMQDVVLNMVVDSQKAHDLLMRDIGTELIGLLTDEDTRELFEDALHLSQRDPLAAREAVIALFTTE